MSGCRVNGGVSGSTASTAGSGTRKLLCNDTKKAAAGGPERMSLTVDAELRELIKQAKQKSGNATASKAIQWALTRALTPPPSAALGLDIIKWAEGLEYLIPRERAELRDLVHEMYKQLR